MESKECTKCLVPKEITVDFAKKRVKDNVYYSAKCKECLKQEKLVKYRSKDGVAYQLYKSQQQSCKDRGMEQPVYTKEELKDWLFSQELFHHLHHLWRVSNYDSMLKPSVDRKDDYESYNFSNIQLMTWNENMKKNDKDRKEGVNTKNSKSVVGAHKKSGKIVEFYSTREAERVTGIPSANISTNCRGKSKSAGGYIWKYKEVE